MGASYNKTIEFKGFEIKIIKQSRDSKFQVFVDLFKDFSTISNKKVILEPFETEADAICQTKSIIIKFLREKSKNSNEKEVREKMLEIIRNMLSKEPQVEVVKALPDNKDIRQGALFIPKDVDIVSIEEVVLVLEDLPSDPHHLINCVKFTATNDGEEIKFVLLSRNNFENMLFVKVAVSSVVIQKYISLKNEFAKFQQEIIDTCKHTVDDINTPIDDNTIDQYIRDSILNSGFDGVIKDKMLKKIQK